MKTSIKVQNRINSKGTTIPTLVIQTNNPSEFVAEVNKFRKKNRNSWYQVEGIIKDKKAKIKAFSTWLQIYLVDNLNYSNPMERKVSEFIEDLNQPFK